MRTVRIIVIAAVLVAAALAGHRLVPNTGPRLGSLVETFLPWLGLAVPALFALACWRRSAVAALSVLLPLAAWLALFGGHLLPRRDAGYALVVVQHNVSDEHPDPTGAARALARERPDLIAMVEVTAAALPAYVAALAGDYPHHRAHGTVALWSRHPLADDRPVDIRPRGVGDDWNRALRATAQTPVGEVAVYVAHLPSVRLGVAGLESGRRDESAARLGRELAAEPLPRTLLLGDLNGTLDDRGLRPITNRLSTDRRDFAFSWPAGAPVARIDHVLARSLTVAGLWSLPQTGSDHLPVAAGLTL